MDLPGHAAWRHVDAREGFEVLLPRPFEGGAVPLEGRSLEVPSDGVRLEGHSCGVEEGVAWAVRYSLVLDAGWVTRSAHVTGWSAAGRHEVRLEAGGPGAWRVDGRPAPHLDGCLDVDLEASACTNALPVRRLALDVGERAEAPAAYVRAPTSSRPASPSSGSSRPTPGSRTTAPAAATTTRPSGSTTPPC